MISLPPISGLQWGKKNEVKNRITDISGFDTDGGIMESVLGTGQQRTQRIKLFSGDRFSYQAYL